MTCRGCSLPLQRAVTDFGADHAFGQVPDKLQEHYGMSLPVGTIRHITEAHARRMYENPLENIEAYPSEAGREYVIAETDGSMVPIVETDEEAEDKRKGKKHVRKEARLCLARPLGEVTPYFGAEFKEGVDKAGKILFDCARRAGFGRKTYLHAVGDGAAWISGQVEKQFGAQGHYLIDFYHTCEYIGNAAKACADGSDAKARIERQEAALKNGQAQKVIDILEPRLEASDVEDKNAPVRACRRYLSNRAKQLDYPGARSKGLPIGSGEIESAHRYVIQKRLKIAGAWWKAANVSPMLALRVIRANGYREQYWCQINHAA